jgi:transcriptional regulator
MQTNPNNKAENLAVPEKKIPAIEQAQSSQIEKKENYIEITPQEKKNISDELKREIEMMELDDKLKEEAKSKAQKMEFLGEQEKIEYLLKIAKEKGVLVAVQAAKDSNDPYILDTLRDLLAKEGFYKNFLRKSDDNDN